MTPLARACKALRLPAGLYCDRGGNPRRDSEIRLALRTQHVGAEQLVLALADVLALPDVLPQHADDVAPLVGVWQLAAAVVKEYDLPASLVGALAILAILPEEGAIDPDELGLWVEAAP